MPLTWTLALTGHTSATLLRLFEENWYTHRREAGIKWTLFPLSGGSVLTGQGHSNDRTFVVKKEKKSYHTSDHLPVFVVAVVCFCSFVADPQWGTADTFNDQEPSKVLCSLE